MTIFTHILFASLFITSISLFVYYKRKFLRLKTDFEKQRAVIVDAVDKMWLDCATALLLSYQSDVEKLSPIFKDAAPSVGYLQYTVNSYQSMGWVCGHWFKKTVVDPITDNIHVTLVNSHKTPSTIGSVSLCLYFTNGELQQIGIANWFPRNISYRFDQGPGKDVELGCFNSTLTRPIPQISLDMLRSHSKLVIADQENHTNHVTFDLTGLSVA